MAVFQVEVENEVDIDKKPRVYFTCHPDDFEKYFKKVCDDIFKTHDCAIYYTEDMTEVIADDEKQVALGRNNLFVIPVTYKLLTTPNRAMDEDIPYALEKHIPVLPILMELVDDELYSSRFGELQYLNPLSDDKTEIPHEEKLKKYLESVLISKELADRIRRAFYAYIFLSYRKVDRAYANTLMRLIHSIPDCRDFAIWFDEFLTPGESFKANIEKALDDCKLFTFLVTERLFKKNINKNGKEEENFVMAEELPKAKEKRAEKGTKIIAVEMENAGKDAPSILEADDYVRYDDLEFRDRILAAISKIKYDAVNTPEHTFLMGLAYLEGIDMEVNRELAVALIENAAEADHAEAMEKLIRMHKDGVGVARDVDSVQKWSKRLADHYFKRIFSQKGKIKSKKKLLELFSHYADEYFAETIKAFLVYTDDRLTEDVITELYDLLMYQGICEYTLFFEACKEKQKHREETQCILLRDILQKSADGIYPPYGPLFWYVPEYELYEPLLLTLAGIINESYFTKALALTRDVCWIFGRYNTTTEITERVNGAVLFANADLVGVRRGLCELFFTGNTDETCGDDVYPRCFNVTEAKCWKEQGQGIHGRMSTAFEDNLELYSHDMFSELDGEYIGIVAAPYNRDRIGTTLSQKSCKKIRGIALLNSDCRELSKLNVNLSNVHTMFVPENIVSFDTNYVNTMQLICSFWIYNDKLLYFIDSIFLNDNASEIFDNAFKNCVKLVRIKLPNNIERIGENAFKGCTSLDNVILPQKVRKICQSAFENCQSLESINFCEGVIAIEGSAFRNCVNLRKISLPKTVEKISSNAFRDCVSLLIFHFPEKIIEIEHSVLEGCVNLSTVYLPPKVEIIGEASFKNCISLKEISFPDSLKKVGGEAFCGCESLVEIVLLCKVLYLDCFVFKGCKKLKRIVLPNGLINIGIETFCGCESLEEISFPKSLTGICEFAFKNCYSLTTLDFLPSLIKIDDGAFSNCINLTNISIYQRTFVHRDAFENCPLIALNYKDKITLKRHLVYRCADKGISLEELERDIDIRVFTKSYPRIKERAHFREADIIDVTVEQGVETIQDYAFEMCSNISWVKLPNSLISIGGYAFADCSSMTQIILGNNIREIGKGCFSGCGSLENISIPSKVKEIRSSTFSNCISLTKIVLHKRIASIGMWAFRGCKSLKNITIPKSVNSIGDGAFLDCETIERIEIPSKVTEIFYRTFENCRSLRKVKLFNNIKKLGHGAFKNCTALKIISLPKRLKIIDPETFANCESLSIISIPEGVEHIYWGSFENCRSLEKVQLPATIKKIWYKTFKGCNSLISIEIPNNVVSIDFEAFMNCSALTNISLPPSLKEIGVHCFENCKSLITITIPDIMQNISSYLFRGCSDLKEVKMSSAVFRIGISSFEGCIGLNKISTNEGGSFEHISSVEDRAFYNCHSFTSFEFSEGLKTIGNEAFAGCSFEKLSIPTSVIEIGDGAFFRCDNLKGIYIPYRFEGDIERIFGDIDLGKVTFF